VSRSWQTRDFVRDVTLIVIDEIHLLGEDRGPVRKKNSSQSKMLTRVCKHTIALEEAHILMPFCVCWRLKHFELQQNNYWALLEQCCGSNSGSGLDPDSMGSLDPYPDPDCESGWRRAKMTHKHRKKLINFMDAGCSLLRAEGFSSSLDISKLQFLIRKRF
jgi:hypothetical protein